MKQKKDLLFFLEFGCDFMLLVSEGFFDLLIGCFEEFEWIVQILLWCIKNNLILFGELGVGKMVIVEGFLQCIVEGSVLVFLVQKCIIVFDLLFVVVGMKYWGQFEECFKGIFKELIDSEDFIVFIDEIYLFIGVGFVEGLFDVVNIFKLVFFCGEILCIGVMMFKEYCKYIEKDCFFLCCFQLIQIDFLIEVEMFDILFGLCECYEKFYGVKYGEDVFCVVIYQLSWYIND